MSNRLEAQARVRDLYTEIKNAQILLRSLKQKYPDLKQAYAVSREGILIAYREGDLTFEEAVKELELCLKKICKLLGRDVYLAKKIEEVEAGHA